MTERKGFRRDDIPGAVSVPDFPHITGYLRTLPQASCQVGGFSPRSVSEEVII